MNYLTLIAVLLCSLLVLAFWIVFGIAARRFPVDALPWILAYLFLPALLSCILPLLPIEPTNNWRGVAEVQFHAMRINCILLLGNALFSILVAAVIVKALPDDARKGGFLRVFGIAYPARHYIGVALLLIGMAVPIMRFNMY